MQSTQVAVYVSPAEQLRLQSPVIENASSGRICIARGDGVGPEIMDAVLNVLFSAGAELDVQVVELGAQAVQQGFSNGISPLAWRILKERKVLLKAPTGGVRHQHWKNPNPVIRKSLGLYASVRPSVAYYPYVPTRHPNMRVTVIRENEEDLYAGIEHRQTHDVAQCLKLISRSGSERVIRQAFEFAQANQRQKVSCFTKDSVMRMTDGMFREVFESVARDFPRIDSEHLLVDTGMARFVSRPEEFDVIVVPNVYGDILSDVAADMCASLAFAPVANVGHHGAMFEAAHGCAPDLAGKDTANPSGLLHAAMMMLHYIGQGEVATRIHQGWLRTLEDGIHTADIAAEHPRARCVGTREFSQAVTARLGSRPRFLKSRAVVLPRPTNARPTTPWRAPAETKYLVGVDVFIQWRGTRPEVLARKLRALSPAGMTLTMISNRGLTVWPQGMHQSVYTDHWRARFVADEGSMSHEGVVALLGALAASHLDFIKTENLYDFDEKPGYSNGDGQ